MADDDKDSTLLQVAQQGEEGLRIALGSLTRRVGKNEIRMDSMEKDIEENAKVVRPVRWVFNKFTGAGSTVLTGVIITYLNGGFDKVIERFTE